jgi:MFS family permease
LLLSLTQSLIVFVLLFCIARMSFASPFELGIYGAVNNWFVQKRGIATSFATFMQMMGLMAMPLIAQLTINTHGWRSGWIAIGITVLIVGFIPVWLLVVRRPEDMGIVPDGTDQTGKEIAQDSQGSPSEPAFTRAQAVRTGTFWLLSLYTLLVYPVQAGVSLHQVPHLIERGIDPTIAATIIGVFSLLSAISGLAFGAFIRRLGVRLSLMVTALFLALSAVVMVWITQSWHGYVAAALFGMGIGGMLTVLPLAWADYFGRASYGAIRGTALAVQVGAQDRLTEMAILRALGAGRRRLEWGLLLEFLILGSMAGLLAAFFAVLAGHILAREVFDLPFQPGMAVWLVGVGGGALGIGLVGLVAIRSVLRNPPLTRLQWIQN